MGGMKKPLNSFFLFFCCLISPNHNYSKRKQSTGEEMLQQFPNRKHYLVLTRELSEGAREQTTATPIDNRREREEP